MNFNSQPHKEADLFLCKSVRIIFISTHSLTRRLTRTYPFGLSRTYISTHSLTRRLTDVKIANNCKWIFQLTASQGGWQKLSLFRYDILHFNSQPHKEADNSPTVLPDYRLISTHSLTRRLTCDSLNLGLSCKYFNSQPHKEADAYSWSQNSSDDISTHSLTRRLTAA